MQILFNKFELTLRQVTSRLLHVGLLQIEVSGARDILSPWSLNSNYLILRSNIVIR